jgi:hypothetical protein
MQTLLTDTPMAETKPKTSSIKLMTDVVESARIVAAYRNEPMTDMLSDLLRPVLARMEREEVTKRSKPAKSKAATE